MNDKTAYDPFIDALVSRLDRVNAKISVAVASGTIDDHAEVIEFLSANVNGGKPSPHPKTTPRSFLKP
jgi:hypothetical protein